jgi:pyrroloquinoline-quinone synthase
MNDYFAALEPILERWNVLRHPFYVRWEQGELTHAELGLYAGQYRHAVSALAETAAATEAVVGPCHAEEEQQHIELWDEFAAAVGAPDVSEPLAATARCARAWTATDALEGLAVLHAVESAQPGISKTKLNGLVAHYGFSESEDATTYFRVHAERDHAHAAEARTLLERHATREDSDRLLGAAGAALRGNWELLDGIEEQGGRPAREAV